MLLDRRIKEKDMLLRILAYGNAKTKKTWWAGKAAEAGYNVLLLDGDDGWHILTQIDPAAQHRIQVVNMTDNLGKPIFAMQFSKLLKKGSGIWNEKQKKFVMPPDDDCIRLNLNALGKYDVLVMDSWTAFVNSLLLQYAFENHIDLSVAEEGEDKWGYYRWAGACATWAATQLTALQCHVICIGHTDVYEKRSKNGKSVEWTKRQIKSTSGPHAMQLPAKFSDILYFYQKGTAHKISAKGNDEEDGGSRVVSPGDYQWADLQFKNIIQRAHLDLPPADNPPIDYSLGASTQAPTTNGLVKPVNKPAAKIVLGAAK